LSFLDIFASRQSHGSLLSIHLMVNPWNVPKKTTDELEIGAKEMGVQFFQFFRPVFPFFPVFAFLIRRARSL